MRLYRVGVLLVSLWTIAFNVDAAVVHDEVVHGDFSNDHMIPTTVTLAIGENLIIGSTQCCPTLDRDFWTVTIEPGQWLETIVIERYTNTDDLSFFGMARGSRFTGLGFSDVSAWALIGSPPSPSLGDDLLRVLNGGPLGPGTYSFWHQETAGDTTYTFNYRVSAVPLPSSLIVLLSGLTVLGTMARKKTTSSPLALSSGEMNCLPSSVHSPAGPRTLAD